MLDNETIMETALEATAIGLALAVGHLYGRQSERKKWVDKIESERIDQFAPLPRTTPRI